MRQVSQTKLKSFDYQRLFFQSTVMPVICTFLIIILFNNNNNSHRNRSHHHQNSDIHYQTLLKELLLISL